MDILLLCLEFFKIGLLAVGGGLAAIPFLIQVSERYPHWFSLSMLADMIAVSESTPGPIGINMSTYVGHTVAGIQGAFLATFSLVLPAFFMMLFIARGLEKYRKSVSVNAVFSGLRPAVTGLIAAAGFLVVRLSVVEAGQLKPEAITLLVVFLVCMRIKSYHPAVYIGVAAVAGMAFSL